MAALSKSRLIIGAVIVGLAGLMIFLTIWDPPAPSEEIRKDVTDDLLVR